MEEQQERVTLSIPNQLLVPALQTLRIERGSSLVDGTVSSVPRDDDDGGYDYLGGNCVDDSVLLALQSCVCLRTLSLAGQTSWTPSALLQLLKTLPVIESLDLSRCTQVRQLFSLSFHYHIIFQVFLSLFGFQVSDALVGDIVTVLGSNLRVLRLSGTSISHPRRCLMHCLAACAYLDELVLPHSVDMSWSMLNNARRRLDKLQRLADRKFFDSDSSLFTLAQAAEFTQELNRCGGIASAVLLAVVQTREPPVSISIQVPHHVFRWLELVLKLLLLLVHLRRRLSHFSVVCFVYFCFNLFLFTVLLVFDQTDPVDIRTLPEYIKDSVTAYQPLPPPKLARRPSLVMQSEPVSASFLFYYGRLPPAVWQRIFEFVSFVHQMAQMALVSRDLNSAIVKTLQVRSLVDFVMFTNYFNWFVLRCECLQSQRHAIDISGLQSAERVDQFLRHLDVHCESLLHLGVSECDALGDRHLESICTSLLALDSIVIDACCQVSDRGLLPLLHTYATSLRSLKLGRLNGNKFGPAENRTLPVGTSIIDVALSFLCGTFSHTFFSIERFFFSLLLDYFISTHCDYMFFNVYFC
jgi:hypothetical protein